MGYTGLKTISVDNDSDSKASLVRHIRNEADYKQALELMDELIEDYDQCRPEIELLSRAIKGWEDRSEQFSEFNRRIKNLSDDVVILRTLMDQYQLNADDFEDELGNKGFVLRILDGSESLTRNHIQALAKRFNLSPSVFYNETEGIF